MTKRQKEKEKIIISQSPNRRPYGAKILLSLEKSTNFDIDGECMFLVSSEIHLKIKPKKQKHGDENNWEIFIDGFATAGEAEQVGLKVTLGFLWAAIQGHYSARLIYHTPLPCIVYDRTQSKGLTMSAIATCSVSKGIANIVDPLDKIISSEKQVDPRLLVAFEIFTAARLETTERAKFVGIVSAIEPIAVQKKYEDENLTTIINEFKKLLKNSAIDQDVKNSLNGRIDQLKLESISRAIKQLIKESLPDDSEALEIIEEAYGLRSKILHEGSTDADLQLKSREVEEIIRKILEVKINQYAK